MKLLHTSATLHVFVWGVCLETAWWTEECNNILLYSWVSIYRNIHTITPTTPKRLENAQNALPRKIQLNKIQVVSATERVRRGEWVEGKDKEAHNFPFRKKTKRTCASACVCVRVSVFLNTSQSFPSKSSVRSEPEPLRLWKSCSAGYPSALQLATVNTAVCHNMFRQHRRHMTATNTLPWWRDKGVAWKNCSEEGRRLVRKPIFTPY